MNTPPVAVGLPDPLLEEGRAFLDSVLSEVVARIPEHVARLSWSPARVAAHQRERLRVLLAHARAHSPFHARRLAAIDPSRFELADLQRLPVMTKAEMMDDLDAVFTDRRLSRAALEEALTATGSEPVALHGRFVALTSGGSSGRRAIFAYDGEALATFVLCVSRQLLARLVAGGGPPPGGVPIALVAAPSPVHLTGLAAAVSASKAAPLRFHSIPATLPLPEIVRRLEAMSPPPLLLYGYPSMLARLAEERRNGRLDLRPLVVTSTSETLSPALRAAIRDGFGVPVVNTFGSTEGLVGSSLPDDDAILFQSDECIVELVDEEHRPVPPGSPSQRILITNLHNRVQPLIRYEIDDRFVAVPAGAESGLLRARVEGRVGDLLRFGDVAVHPLALGTVLMETSAVVDYRVLQTRRGIDVEVEDGGGLEVQELGLALREALAAAGVPEAEVAIRVVPALARQRETGKLRRFVALGSPGAEAR